jgi:hypothetical protein
MKKKFSTIRITFLLFCAIIGVRTLYYGLTEGFSLQRIQEKILFPGNFSLPPPSRQQFAQLQSCTKRRFLYLAKGSQAYAFISEDGNYVLKLFKCHHMRPAPSWFQEIPLPDSLAQYRDSLVARRDHRVSLALNSYKVAATTLRRECALIYAQILPSKQFSLPVTIRDGIGREYSIDLAAHGFALQQRADLVQISFRRWIAKNDMESAKKAIDSLVGVIVRRSKKEVQDSDPDLHKNAGLIGTKAVFIDIGSFHKNPKISSYDEMRSDMKKVFGKFSRWLSKESEELHAYLQERLESPWEGHRNIVATS